MATLFVLVFVTELISWIGKSVLLEFVRIVLAWCCPIQAYHFLRLQVFALYLRIFYSSTAARQRKLKSEILLNKKELLQTSAQDQFAKWAKLRRSVDKGLADLEKLSKSGGTLYPLGIALEAAARTPLACALLAAQRHSGPPRTPPYEYRPPCTQMLTALPRRWRAGVGADILLAQVQLRDVGDDDRAAIRDRVVVPQGSGVLPAPRLVWAADLGARVPVRACGLRELRHVADGV